MTEHSNLTDGKIQSWSQSFSVSPVGWALAHQTQTTTTSKIDGINADQQ
ncbi:hypothetical protein [Shewanella woodyi]